MIGRTTFWKKQAVGSKKKGGCCGSFVRSFEAEKNEECCDRSNKHDSGRKQERRNRLKQSKAKHRLTDRLTD